MNAETPTSGTQSPAAPRLQWTLIKIRDGSYLWLYDRDTTEVAAVEGGGCSGSATTRGICPL